jgi:hypothetical protein
MAKCPKCNVEIDYLHYYEERGFTIEIDAKGEPVYEEKQKEAVVIMNALNAQKNYLIMKKMLLDF